MPTAPLSAEAITARLAELGFALPKPAAPVANYVPFAISGTLLVISGQGSILGETRILGKLGDGLSLEDGVRAAQLCFVNLLAQVGAALDGDFGRLRRLVRLGGFIAATAAFTDHARVMNGASDLAVAVFGERGRHARTTVGVPSLPLDFAVEIEGMFEIA